MSLEEISRLWGAIQSHYRPTAAYQASVVLIESRRSVRSALPVADDMRRIYVIPFRQPVIEGVVNADGDLAPIAAGATLAIRGRELAGEGTLVNLDGIEVTPAAADLTPEQIALPLTSPLPAGLLAGVKGVQVIHRIKMGDPETDHRGTESNVAAFVLRPTITNGPVIGAGDIVGMTSSTELVDGVTVQLRAGSLRLDFDPNVGKEQRVTLFLNQLNAGPGIRPRAYTFRAPAGNGVPDGSDDIASVDIPFVRVVAGTYLVRAQVNGAESLLAPDGTGAFATPRVDVRMSAAIAPAAVESLVGGQPARPGRPPRPGPRALLEGYRSSRRRRPRSSPTSGTLSAASAATFGLTPFERDIVVLCAGVELEGRFAALVAAPPAHAAPTFGLALDGAAGRPLERPHARSARCAAGGSSSSARRPDRTASCGSTSGSSTSSRRPTSSTSG